MSDPEIQVTDGLSGVGPSGELDPVDEFLLLNTFEQAAAYLQQTSLQLSNEQKLRFYGLFKQTTVGENRAPKPGLLRIRDRAKWQAWKDVGRLPKDKAAQEYIALLDEVAPTWRAEILTMEDRTKDGGGGAGEEEEEIDLDATTSEDDWDTQVPRPPGTGAGQGDGDGFGINVSRPVLRPEDEEGESLEGMFLAASKGDLESIKRAVQQEGKDINSKTPAEQGELSCLHIAVDRDHCALIPHLVEMKANLDQMDDMQQTPLHYAVTIERLDCVQLLLELGADPDLPDETGETPAMAAGKARDPEIRKAFASPQASERGAAEKEKTD